jgi:uncharacterized membrane protein
MKPALTAITAAILFGLVFAFSGHPLEITDYVVIVFATSIVMWTFEQYDHHRAH